jgi:hypothetical protein
VQLPSSASAVRDRCRDYNSMWLTSPWISLLASHSEVRRPSTPVLMGSSVTSYLDWENVTS